MIPPLRVAVAGLGTVGAAVVDILRSKRDLIAARCGRLVDVTAVSARDRHRRREIDLSGCVWFDDAAAMAAQADADVVVELIGGEDGVAKAVCESALAAGRDLVTANKALLARHGAALARAAEAAGAGLGYEASVAGGIPAIKALREGFAGNRVSRIHGILNGTCNYILTAMRETGRNFPEILADAQRLGYAEADPGFDIDGIDAAHKLALLAAAAFGREVDFRGVHVEGIRRVTVGDIEFAGELGYRVKLLGIAEETEEGVEQRVHPCMVPVDAPLAHVEGVFNAVVVEGDSVGRGMLEGRGAGAGPTASAVVSDIVDFARGVRLPAFSLPASRLRPARAVPMGQRTGPCYVRLSVVDRPGVIADVSAALRDERVSVESFIQRARSPEESVPVVLTLHEAREDAVGRALDRIGALDTVLERPCMIRIENL